MPIFGRFGQLLVEICGRPGANVVTIEAEWGTVFEQDRVIDAIKKQRPKLVAIIHGDTSTTLAQPLDRIGAACRKYDALIYADATATLGGNPVETDAWQIDAVSAGCRSACPGLPVLPRSHSMNAWWRP